jgi:hypothetical protein
MRIRKDFENIINHLDKSDDENERQVAKEMR